MNNHIPRAVVVECVITNMWACYLKIAYLQHARKEIPATSVICAWDKAYLANAEQAVLGVAQ